LIEGEIIKAGIRARGRIIMKTAWGEKDGFK
jgi:hypothetical protein